MKNIFFAIFMFLIFISCSKKSSSNKAKNLYKQDNKTSQVKLHEDCSETIQIRNLIINFKKNNDLRLSLIDSLTTLFKINKQNQTESPCNDFPSKTEDNKLFYYFMDRLINEATSNNKFILPYIEISKTMKTNIEAIEYLMHSFNKIALNNPEGFLLVYSESDSEEKKILQNGLGFLWDFDYLESFREKIISIKDSKLVDPKNEVLNEINKMSTKAN